MSKHFYAIVIASLALIFFLLSIYSLRIFGGRTNAVQEEIIIGADEQSPDPTPRDSSTLLPDEPLEPLDDAVVDQNLVPSPTAPEPSDELAAQKRSAYYITRENCDDECSSFDENTSPLRYCQQICGIIPPKDGDVDCDVKSGLSRDYCIKDRAVSSNKPADCESISDKGIWDQCRKQIIENTVDGF